MKTGDNHSGSANVCARMDTIDGEWWWGSAQSGGYAVFEDLQSSPLGSLCCWSLTSFSLTPGADVRATH